MFEHPPHCRCPAHRKDPNPCPDCGGFGGDQERCHRCDGLGTIRPAAPAPDAGPSKTERIAREAGKAYAEASGRTCAPRAEDAAEEKCAWACRRPGLKKLLAAECARAEAAERECRELKRKGKQERKFTDDYIRRLHAAEARVAPLEAAMREASLLLDMGARAHAKSILDAALSPAPNEGDRYIRIPAGMTWADPRDLMRQTVDEGDDLRGLLREAERISDACTALFQSGNEAHARALDACPECFAKALAAAREAAFREGAEALMERIVDRIWNHEWRDTDELVRDIRALPLPEVK